MKRVPISSILDLVVGDVVRFVWPFPAADRIVPRYVDMIPAGKCAKVILIGAEHKYAALELRFKGQARRALVYDSDCSQSSSPSESLKGIVKIVKG